MAYAQGRVYYDSDSHLMESTDWLLSHASDGERRLITPFDPKNAGKGVEKAIARAQARSADPEATRALLEEPIMSGPKGWLAYGAMRSDERSRALDLMGFSRQLVFPTFALGQFARASNPEVLYAGAAALNRGMGAFCKDDPRLMGVGYLPLDVPARALAELDAGLKAGVRAFWLCSEPSSGRSPSHVDHEPIWAALAGANVPIMLHIGGGRMLPPEYHNTGRPRPTDWLGGGENLRGKDLPAVAQSPQNFLTSLVLDGVFMRHPQLRCGVIELGATWVPGYVRLLDQAHRSFHKTEPLLAELELKPSEYIRRQVRFSLFPFDDAGWLIEQAGDELFMFASDYPHPEGSKDPVGRFETFLEAAKIGEPARDRFYRGNFAELMAI